MKLKNMTLKDLPFYEGENGEYKTAKPMKHAVTLEILREWALAKVEQALGAYYVEKQAVALWIIKNFNLKGKDIDG